MANSANRLGGTGSVETVARLTGRSIFVTGGSSGIGRAVAILSARAGARVTIADVNEEAGNAVAAEIRASGGEALFVRGDVTDEGQMAAGVKAAIRSFGRVDGACNAAGMVFKGVRIHEIPTDFWDKVTAVNLRGIFISMKYEIPAMLEAGGGSIVNIASTAALRSFPNGAEYCATKAGSVGLTRSAAVEYAANAVRVNAVLPGATRTPMLMKGFDSVEGLEQQAVARVPMGRLAEPVELAMAICWLLSDEARFVTGVLLPVDGGLTASL
jgi:2,5-dichloro-2,5-cyclohexadiene-1,4-diol dehydrogenase 1